MSRSASSISSITQPATPRVTEAMLDELDDTLNDSDFAPSYYSSSAPARVPVPNTSAFSPSPSQTYSASDTPAVRPRRTGEPPVVTTLTLIEQKPYVTALLKICISAAHSFYTLHKLHTALDKKSVPIFLTKDKQVARLPYDLTLPQWTQHLRKACDTRHITENMVYSLESFKGEIQPVDEVRHALMKEKVKNDRSLLALIEAARTFVKQLKDWDRCEMIDGVYEEVEMVIRLKKREAKRIAAQGQEEGSEKSARRLTWT
ncbi:hypothetical protein ABW19_dt0208164 [Dactylella cylindrospora]|nr:hypothetical protein ABW19_dt0208164 [Dactylella cylindrospora]